MTTVQYPNSQSTLSSSATVSDIAIPKQWRESGKWKWTDRAKQCCWWKCWGGTSPTKWCLETGGIHTCQENAEGFKLNSSLKTANFKKFEDCYNWSLEEFKYVPTLNVTKVNKGNAQKISLLTNTMTRSFFLVFLLLIWIACKVVSLPKVHLGAVYIHSSYKRTIFT